MNKLYNIMRREKERNPDMDIYYSQKNMTLQYINKEGTLTVSFEKDGLEDFHYRSANDKNTVGKGERVQALADKGHYGHIYDPLFDMPQRFKDITQSYQFDRDSMNIDFEENKKIKSRNNYERY